MPHNKLDTDMYSGLRLVLAASGPDLRDAWEVVADQWPGLVTVHHGDIMDVDADAYVSPANSYGFMDGGIDRAYVSRFGFELQTTVRHMILSRHCGELLVGSADIVPAAVSGSPWLIVAPTMRVPMALPVDTVNPYLAARAVLLLWRDGCFADGTHAGQPVRDHVTTIAMPGLGTGVGCVSTVVCARQVARALVDVSKPMTLPESWADASFDHQMLYTDNPTRLQR